LQKPDVHPLVAWTLIIERGIKATEIIRTRIAIVFLDLKMTSLATILEFEILCLEHHEPHDGRRGYWKPFRIRSFAELETSEVPLVSRTILALDAGFLGIVVQSIKVVPTGIES
jgi:hypothetical protein